MERRCRRDVHRSGRALVRDPGAAMGRFVAALMARGCAPRMRGPSGLSRCPCAGHGRGRGDRNPSLSFWADPDGWPRWRCFAGCGGDDVRQAMGLEWSDVRPARDGRPDGPRSFVVPTRSSPDPSRGTWLTRLAKEAFYGTPDAARLALAETLYPGRPDAAHLGDLRVAVRPDGVSLWPMRGDEASIVGVRTRRPDGGKAAIAGSSEGLFVPARIALAVERVGTLWVVEGASDVPAARLLGLSAVGLPAARGPGRRAIDILAGLVRRLGLRRTVIVADADGTGAASTAAVAGRLALVCGDVRAIRPPGGCKDARAAVLAGATAEEFLDAAAAAALIRPRLTAGPS